MLKTFKSFAAGRTYRVPYTTAMNWELDGTAAILKDVTSNVSSAKEAN